MLIKYLVTYKIFRTTMELRSGKTLEETEMRCDSEDDFE